jgi:DNA-binding winged helix-turn-helix (wHTH) protein/tetratricopeptide (TPR) repeat protein
MSPLQKRVFEFGPFSLNAVEHTLQRDGMAVPLRPKVFDILLALVERHGHLVAKDELIQLVWPEQFVDEGNLNKTVSLLRLALGESNGGGKGEKYIETVPKRGYRFVADVRAVHGDHVKDYASEIHKRPLPGPEEKTETALTEISSNERNEPAVCPQPVHQAVNASTQSAGNLWRAFKNKAVVLYLSAAIMIVALLAVASYFLKNRPPIPSRGKTTIAVLPLKPINSENREEIYEIGIADSLIQRFGSMGLKVRPLSATRKYSDIGQDPIAAGREQRVDYILAANYQLADGKIKVSAQLFNVATEQIEDTYKSEKDAGDLFAMQDAIAADIGNRVLGRFVTASGNPTARRGTTNEEAYRLYLQAMYLYDRRDRAAAQKAVELLEQAIQLDAKFARAWAGKAHVHRALANFSGNTHEEYKKSMEAVNRALALDENLSDAHSALCENRFFYEWDFGGAELECKRAIELDPGSSLAHQIYSRNLMVLERFDESIAEIKTAIDLDPASLFSQRNFGIAYYYARRYPEAVTQFKRVVEMDSNFEATYPWLINTLKLQGKEAEALEWFMKWQEVRKADQETLQAFRSAYQKSGWRGVEVERVKRFDESKIRTYFMEACMAAQAGNKSKALEYLENSYQRREWGMAYIRFEPALDVLRGDPRFDELLRRVALEVKV